MKVSVIISAYNRPDHLALLLRSLKVQTFKDFEVIVCDESENAASPNFEEYLAIRDERFRYLHTPRFNDWGYSAKAMGAKIAQGEYLCFPADDSYYVPTFLEKMTSKDFDLIYCDWLFDQYGYAPVSVRPEIGAVDVGGFLVKRDIFLKKGWGEINNVCDGNFVLDTASEYTHGKPEGVLYVKN